jgi:hypothetical protein
MPLNTITGTTQYYDCIKCPRGALCQDTGVSFENMQTTTGWWRVDNTSLTFYRCLLPIHCQGGRESACKPNRQGPLCARCSPGYKSSSGTSECKLCPSAAAAGTTSVLIIAAVIALLILMYWIVLRNDRPMMQAAAERDRKQIEWDWQEENEDAGIVRDVVTTESRAVPNFTYKLKIIVGFLQIATNLAYVVEVPWPSYYSTFINAFDVVNLDFLPWQSVGCVSSLNFYVKFVMLTIIPLVILMFIAIFFLIPMCLLDRAQGGLIQYRTARNRARRKFWKLALFTSFLMYPIVSRSVLSIFICKDVVGVYYMNADFSIVCFDDAWNRILPYAVLMICIYPIGIPLFFVTTLYSYRERLMEPGVRVQLGFLYEAYHVEMWW